MCDDINKNKEYQKAWSVSICKESEKGNRKETLYVRKEEEKTYLDGRRRHGNIEKRGGQGGDPKLARRVCSYVLYCGIYGRKRERKKGWSNRRVWRREKVAWNLLQLFIFSFSCHDRWILVAEGPVKKCKVILWCCRDADWNIDFFHGHF